MIDKPEAFKSEQDMSEQEWGGEGLPPVGANVRYVCDDETGTVITHGRDGKVCIKDKDGYIGIFHTGELEPIRTAAQRAEDEAVEAMLQALGFRKPYDIGVCHKIYAAIRDGRIPGVRLDN